MRFALPLLALLAAAPAAAQTTTSAPYNWGLEESDPAFGEDYARSKAICRRVGEPRPPAADLPTPAQVRALKGCSSRALYYGVGARPDYVRARLCAFTEAREDGGLEISGPSVLMQVYANGLGVKRDLDLATGFACQIEGSPAESDGRVLHLEELRAKPGVIDFCDDITSGLAGGVCASRNAEMAAGPRNARLQALVAGLRTDAQPLWPPLKAAFDAFVEADGAVVEDGGGTAAFGNAVETQEAARDAFLRDLAALLAGRWAVADAAKAAAADARLNAAYRKAMAAAQENGAMNEASVTDLRKSQRAWLAFRDAYVRFAAVAALGVTRETVLARLSEARSTELDGLADVG